jgi:hypothetical protein
VAITPSKVSSYPIEVVKKICHDYTMIGLETMLALRRNQDSNRSFRFLYMSGWAAERDPAKRGRIMREYGAIRVRLHHSIGRFCPLLPLSRQSTPTFCW